MEVIAYLESLYNVRITPHNTLIILDEIQDCKRALLALKYFQEEYPQYDIVAAGSLLEPIAYRISSKNFGFGNGIKSIPLYAAFCIEVE